MLRSLVGSEMCIRDRYQRRVRGTSSVRKCTLHGFGLPCARAVCNCLAHSMVWWDELRRTLGFKVCTSLEQLSLLHWANLILGLRRLTNF
eukprot:TRINITY_DN14562_c0_g1_i6.p5 TRINITY_DN14562_c0_g1~~TRINITY_DN14562_c0_g1_i6.p5  ORF type:complete len:105 (+),score=31.75 TRINITY_DN14562_c0_g1_i6:46-315(+)